MAPALRILALTPPGRLPTVVHDPGRWWDRLAADGRFSLSRVSLSHAWWTELCSPAFPRLILGRLGLKDRLLQQMTWAAAGLDVAGLSRRAGEALRKLQRLETFDTADTYLDALAPLSAWLEIVPKLQREFTIDPNLGPAVRSVNYADSRSVVSAATDDGLLTRSLERLARPLARQHDLFLLSVTSSEDLLTAAAIAAALHRENPQAHVCLADHGYENFSLGGHIEALKATGALEEVFDTIVTARDERDEATTRLAYALANGLTPRGYVSTQDLPACPRPSGPASPPPPLPTFSPAPVLWTRVSERRCYWSRCTFCTQNAKYDDPGAPTARELAGSVDRLAWQLEAGFDHVIFADEALSPSLLWRFEAEVTRRGMEFDWACRCKLEKQHTPDLFQALGRSGCAEILYGIESFSDRVLGLMAKQTPGVDEAFVAAALGHMDAAGIGAHVNLLAGFPGDTLAEAQRSADLLAAALRPVRGATYLINGFALFDGAPVADRPQDFGVAAIEPRGDLPVALDHQLTPALAAEAALIAEHLPAMRGDLDGALGWDRVIARPGGGLACALYFGSGHGLIFKARRAGNPFGSNPVVHSDKAVAA